MNIKQILAKRLVKNSMWLFVLQVFNTVIPLLTLPYITRVLGDHNYGIFSLALNWVTYFQVIVEYGFGFTGARKVSVAEANEEEYDLQALYSRIITARLILFIISFALMTIVAILTKCGIEQYVSMCILFLMVLGISFQLTWLFQGKQDMKIVTIINAISRAGSVIFIFILVKHTSHLFLYCLCYSITFVFSAMAGMMCAKKKYGLKLRLCSIRNAFSEMKDGWYLFTSQAMGKVFSGIGVTVLGEIATAAIVGIYSAIYKIPFMLILFFNPISQSLYPYISAKFSKDFKDGERAVKKIAGFVVSFFALAGFVIILFRDVVVGIAFGENYVAYSDIIIPLVLWMILSIANNFLGTQYLVASGHQKLYSKAFSISIVITIALNLILGNIYNVYGIASAATLGEFSLTLLLIYNIKVRLKKQGAKGSK